MTSTLQYMLFQVSVAMKSDLDGIAAEMYERQAFSTNARLTQPVQSPRRQRGALPNVFVYSSNEHSNGAPGGAQPRLCAELLQAPSPRPLRMTMELHNLNHEHGRNRLAQ